MLATIQEEDNAEMPHTVRVQTSEMAPLISQTFESALIVTLPHTQIEHCVFKNCEFKTISMPALLNTTFSGCTFTNCTWCNTVLRNIEWIGCTFNQCTFSNASVRSCICFQCTCHWDVSHSQMASLTLQDSSLVGTIAHTEFKSGKFERVVVGKESAWIACGFNSTTLESVQLLGTLNNVSFKQCSLHSCKALCSAKLIHSTFAYSSIQSCYFLESDFSGTTFLHTQITSTKILRANFRNAQLHHVTFEFGTFSYNTLWGAELMNIVFNLCATKANNKEHATFSNVLHKMDLSVSIELFFKEDFQYRTSYTYELEGVFGNGDAMVTDQKMVAVCAKEDSKSILFTTSAEFVELAALLTVKKVSTSRFAFVIPFSAVSDESVFTHMTVNGHTTVVKEAMIAGSALTGFDPRPNSRLRQRSRSL